MKCIAAAAALLALAACSKNEPAKSHDEGPTKPSPVATTATTATDAGAAKALGMVWVEEDYEKALSLAKARKLPLVIDAWARWCHTCMDMDRLVLTEQALGEISSEFIWLRLDRERPQHAPVMAKYPIAVSPTYYVVDPENETVLGRQLGGSTVAHYQQFLKRSQATRTTERAAENPADQLLLDGARAAAEGKADAAKQLFADARKAAPEGWPRLPELLLAQMNLLYNAKEHQACATLALEALPLATGAPASLGIVAFEAEMCAQQVKKPLAKKVRKAIVSAVDTSLASHTSAGVLEVSEAMQMKRYALQGLGLEKEAIAAARDEIKRLTAAAESAATPRDAMAYQIVVAEAFVFLGEQEDFIPVLEKAAADLPLEYHIKFLLGQLYYLDERYDDAQSKAERALELSYGPQRGTVHAFLAEVYLAQGEPEKEEEARKAVLAFYEGLPVGHRRAAELEAAKEALANITGK